MIFVSIILIQIESIVNNFTSSADIAIYSKSYCPYCMQAKGLFKMYYGDYSLNITELDQMSNSQEAAEIQNYIGKITGTYTVPQVFIYGNCIGGASESMKKHQSGELQNLLENK